MCFIKEFFALFIFFFYKMKNKHLMNNINEEAVRHTITFILYIIYDLYV